MIDTTENNCSVSAELVSYLYHEQSETERNGFEFHLADCGICADEFAELSFSRYAMFEWNRDEFALIATPEFSIPYETVELGWFAGLRERISFNWLSPVAVAAALMIVVGVSFFGIAFRTDENAFIPTNALPVADSRPVYIPETLATPSLDDEVVKAVVSKSRESEQVNAVKTRRAKPQVAATKSANSIQKPLQRNSLAEITAGVEEDDSLRLADLFDGIDSK